MRALILFGFFSAIALFVMFFGTNQITGAAALNCSKGFVPAGSYCIDEGCLNKTNKCIKEGNTLKRPDCHCTGVMGKLLCTIGASKKTAFVSPLCQRRGQLGQVCGSYNSSIGRCVENQNIKEGTEGLGIRLR